MTAAQRIKKLEDRIAQLEAQVLALQARPSIVVLPAQPAPPPVYPTPTYPTWPPTWPPNSPYAGDPPGYSGGTTISCSGQPS